MDPVELIACPPERTQHALHVLFASLPEKERASMVQSLLSAVNPDDPNGTQLLIAVRKTVIRGAVLVQKQPGRTAVLWPPHTLSADRALDLQLAQLADRILRESDVTMAQSLLSASTDPAIPVLQAIGFTQLTVLEYMHAAPVTRFRETACPVRFERFQPEDRARLQELIESSYTESQDCPQLNGVRDPADVLAGYAATGESGTSHWYFVRNDEADAGVLLLAEHGGAGLWELVYMGVRPAVRRRGIGQAMVRFALDRAARAGAGSFLLAVDANNRRAQALYQQCGFRTWDARTVFWKRYARSAR